MIQFYKKRNFRELISDTFYFLKLYGKNYFTNYFLINGLLLILMMFLMVIGLKDILAFFISGTTPSSSFIENYFSENLGVIIVVFIIVSLLFLITMVINYSFPVFYIKRIAETHQQHIKLDEILSDIKQNSGRMFIFFLGLTFIITPLSILALGISYILVLLIIGFFLLILSGPTIMNIVNFTLYDYLNTQKGFFSSFSYAIRSQFSYPNATEGSPFWKYWGSTIVIYIIIQSITTIFTSIPLFLLIIIPELVSSGIDVDSSYSPIIFLIFYSLAILLSFIMSNLIYICTGFMYYDNRTDLHRKVDLSEIDNIGKYES